MGSGSIGNLWIYIVAPVLGGLAAVPVFKLQTRSTGT
jgi:glycerol uptake facilitator-like aquaporin